MITKERLAAYKRRALASVASRANNPAAPGVACVSITPHDLLALLLSYEERQAAKAEEKAGE